MKFTSKGKYLAGAMAAVLGLATAANASPTMTLSTVYVGSALSTDATSASFDGTVGSLFSTGVTTMNLNAVSTQTTPNLVNMFAVYLKYTPSVSASTDFFQTITWQVQMGPGAHGVAPEGTPELDPSGNPLWFDSEGAFATYLSSNSNAQNDLNAIFTAAQTVWNNVKSVKYATASMPTTKVPYDPTLGTPLGFFGMQFNGALAQDITVGAIAPYGDGSASYYPSNGTTAPDAMYDVLFASAPVTILGQGVITPEPASLGVLALGGLALLARRRKAA